MNLIPLIGRVLPTLIFFDSGLSTMAFSVPILHGLSQVTGRFKSCDVRISMNESDVTKSTFSASIDAASIDTNIDHKTRRKDHDYTYFDLLPAYWSFEKATVGDSNATSVKRFDSSVIGPKREVFEAVASGWIRPENIGRLLENLKGKEADFRLVESLFQARFEGAWRRFKKDCPGLREGFSVYLLPAPRIAVGGAVRPLAHTDAVVFGAEEIRGVIDSQEAFDVLVQHELTHLYHMQVNNEMRQMIKRVYMPPFEEGRARLYQVLWLEGLAVYRSKVLNPSATLKETVLSASVAREARTQWPKLGANLRGVLDSTKSADINAYLFDGPNDNGIRRGPATTSEC